MNDVTKRQAFDAYGHSHHPQREVNTASPFLGSRNQGTGYSDPTESRENISVHPAPDVNGNPHLAPPTNGKMADPSDTDGVSPELIAAITDRVKKELVQHLKQTGSIDDRTKGPPLQRVSSNKSSSTSSPPPTQRRVYTPPSPATAPKQAPFRPPPDPMRSPPGSPLEKPQGVRFSEPSERPDRSERLSRPSAAGRTYSTLELSTIDQKWGRLFDSDGNPTQRLGQFLRGLANHIIDEFMPKKSIVITPSKMAAFYATHSLEKEMHPLVSIFNAPPEVISLLYQDLGCQHHLVQENHTSPPTIPALTPMGFAHWMTFQILAYPNEESKRLEKVVLAMPIDADGQMIDGRPERLPKQISRHLLPEREDRKSRKLFDNAVLDFLEDLAESNKQRKPATSQPRNTAPPPPPTPNEMPKPRTSPTAAPQKPIERERMPYAGAPTVSEQSSNVSNDETVKLERDRQPYSAQPGHGRVYNDGSNLDTPPKVSRVNSTSRARSPTSTSRARSPSTSHTRSPSATSGKRSPSAKADTRHKRAQSNASQSYPPPPRASVRRDKSPPFKSYSNSTPSEISNNSNYGVPPYPKVPPSFPQQTTPASYPTTSFPPPPTMERESSARDKYQRDDRPYRRRTMDEDAPRPTSEFQSPRDAERWDRIHELRTGESSDHSSKGYDRRASMSMDHRDMKGPPHDSEFPYREMGRGNGGYDRYDR